MVEIARSFNVSHTTIARLGSEYLQAGWRKVSMGGHPAPVLTMTRGKKEKPLSWPSAVYSSWLAACNLSNTSERTCDRPYVDHGTERHSSFADNVGPNLGGVSGDGDFQDRGRALGDENLIYNGSNISDTV